MSSDGGQDTALAQEVLVGSISLLSPAPRPLSALDLCGSPAEEGDRLGFVLAEGIRKPDSGAFRQIGVYFSQQDVWR